MNLRIFACGGNIRFLPSEDLSIEADLIRTISPSQGICYHKLEIVKFQLSFDISLTLIE